MPIELLDLDTAREEIASGTKLIDVREQNEWDESHIDAALHVPQGELVERIDEIAPDTSERLLLHCRTDNRSSTMAAELSGLGYDNVGGGRGRDRRLGERRAADRQRLRSQQGAADALLAPHAAAGGRGRGPAEAAELEGPAARRRRSRRPERALPRRGRHRHDRDRRRRRGRRVQPPAPGDPQHRARRDPEDRLGEAHDRGAQPRRRGRRVQHPPRRLQHPRPDRALRRHRRRRRQLPDPLPAQRRLGAARQAGRLGLDPGLRGPDLDLPPARGPLLPLPLPGAAAAGARAELRRQRRPRRDGRGDGSAAGQRGDQAGRRDRRAARRPPAALRVAEHDASPSSRSSATRRARSAATTRPRSSPRRWASSPTTSSSAAPRRASRRRASRNS